jgi:DNA polymerase I-like protein with 3'-5' exonuclease and polymerase domains
VLYQIGTEELVYIIEPDLLTVDGRFKEMLEGTQNLFLLQNAVHDFKFTLMKYGIHYGRIYCTMLAEQILTAGKEGVKVGLSELARKYPPYRYIRKTVRTDFIRHSGSFTREQLYYGARDVMLLPAIAKAQIAQIKQLGLLAVAKDEFDSIPVTAEMEIGGVYLDKERIALTKAYSVKESARAQKEADDIYNQELRRLGLIEVDLLGERIEHVDLASPAQKMEALKRIGIYVEDVQRETLEALTHPIGQPMADYLAYQKIISTYCDGLLAKVHPDTKLVHPKFNQHGRGDRDSSGDDGKANIATGRYSGDMQQLPRPEKIYDEVVDPAEIEEVHARWPERFALAA